MTHFWIVSMLGSRCPVQTEKILSMTGIFGKIPNTTRKANLNPQTIGLVLLEVCWNMVIFMDSA
jgi:hypothetical protein